MPTEPFERARSADAKRAREQAILQAARGEAQKRGIREITLTDIADAVGMHKSGLLRYFETREQIFLRLTAEEWRSWAEWLLPLLSSWRSASPLRLAAALSDTLVSRPLFCDLLAHTPLNLERNVSVDTVREFKLDVHTHVEAIAGELRRLRPGLTEPQAIDVIATATSMAGAQWQMATPGPELQALYRSDPRLRHAIVEVGPRLTRVLTALLTGMAAAD
ncbi:TetR family transcriptional regulator [Leifsonia sp. ZF2019]|uniref:TetR family transcriptional regulator n=1 Tax=Leifsonia sp. ZF2019 TaxID=2781978 RepID=UPI001CBC0D3F|nr:TetR family transcriptional regulator [Leifsonia sp. ZF2019]UAJ78788.1 TetR family transcriptional regulator [Leifsonia sp. ZF2019]